MQKQLVQVRYEFSSKKITFSFYLAVAADILLAVKSRIRLDSDGVYGWMWTIADESKSTQKKINTPTNNWRYCCFYMLYSVFYVKISVLENLHQLKPFHT